MLLSSSCFFLIAFTFCLRYSFSRKVCPVVHLWWCPLHGSLLCWSGSKYLKTIFSRERMSFSAMYFGSLLMTLYSVLSHEVICTRCFQLLPKYRRCYGTLHLYSGEIRDFPECFCHSSNDFRAGKCCGKSVGRMFGGADSSVVVCHSENILMLLVPDNIWWDDQMMPEQKIIIIFLLVGIHNSLIY